MCLRKDQGLKERRANERMVLAHGIKNQRSEIRTCSYITRAASNEPGSNTALVGTVCTVGGGGIETRVCPGLLGARRVPAREREAPVGLGCGRLPR